MSDNLQRLALEYHRLTPAGKLTVTPTKPIAGQQNLALAYSPGVAAPCREIAANPEKSFEYTARGNLVAVVTNGTAVLGLGNIGPLAAKPVMEGKVVLFKHFADIDAFDLEFAISDTALLIDAVAALEPTFGGINLEDIKSPECFEIEAALQRRMKIPVLHDDQHGTAIAVAAAVLNALLISGKSLRDIRLVTTGAGAAAIASVELLVELGLTPSNVILTDKDGVVHSGRAGLSDVMMRYAESCNTRTLPEALEGADVFLGLSAPGVFRAEWLKTLANNPLILALANPEPEIWPETVRAARTDAIIATGRSDYSNQVNNALCFPYIFRGALDTRATEINNEMKVAAVYALAELARDSVYRDPLKRGYPEIQFGPDYIIPTPFDPRLISRIAPAVAQAAMRSGVARRSIDIPRYRAALEQSPAAGSRAVLAACGKCDGHASLPSTDTADEAHKNRPIF